jgi:hypothetical protein
MKHTYIIEVHVWLGGRYKGDAQFFDMSQFILRSETHTFVIKMRRALLWCISNYESKGRHVLLMACLLLAMKADASSFSYKGRRALELHVSVLYSPYNV